MNALLFPGSATPSILGFSWQKFSQTSDIVLDTDKTVDIEMTAVEIDVTSTDANGVPVAAVHVGVDGESTLTDDGARFSGKADSGLRYMRTTDGNGDYRFWIPPYSDYRLRVVPPAQSDFFSIVVPHLDFRVSQLLEIILSFDDVNAPKIIASPRAEEITDNGAVVL